MTEAHKIAPILMAEDDPDDRLITKKALDQNRVANPLVTVGDGEELMDYLKHRGKYSGSNPQSGPVSSSWT